MDFAIPAAEVVVIRFFGRGGEDNEVMIGYDRGYAPAVKWAVNGRDLAGLPAKAPLSLSTVGVIEASF